MSGARSARDLIAEAQRVAGGAYAPYSQFHVGAVAVAEDGTEYTGANVENAAYGATMCAEANAIGSAVSAGVRRIDTVAVAASGSVETYPCGNCRQLMREFGVRRVVVTGPDGEARVHPFTELLPRSFGPEDLPATS